MAELVHLAPYPQQLELKEGVYGFGVEGIIQLKGGRPQDLLPAGAAIEKTLWSCLRINWELSAAQNLPIKKVKVVIETEGDSKYSRSQLYTLEIKPNLIHIKSNTATGAFYAAQTLSQLIRQFGHEIPCLYIEDWPDFETRGVMLDISRDKVYKAETLYELVDRLASIKINQLQLYTEHTFAYHNHPDVWRDASPVTGEDILALDRYCHERFIELVPNQNSFGHMERWLKHEKYTGLAEIVGEFPVPWGTMRGPFSLAPQEPGSLELLRSLYDELLPHFSSRKFNIGCDETFDLGAGKSKNLCESRGTGRVYLEFLLNLYEEVKLRGFQPLFWGDIILQHPELVAEIPKDMVALEWGYEANHPFAEHARMFKASGLEFYVCPGTSSWNTIAGRTKNALDNLANAAQYGKLNDASGYLITDWGDNGHWQTLPISFLGFLAGAAYSWSFTSNQDIDIPDAVSRWMFDDPSGSMGKLAYDLGNLYTKVGVEIENGSALFGLMQMPLVSIANSGKVHADNLIHVSNLIDEILGGLTTERMTRPDADIIRDEFALSGMMLRHGCNRGLLAVNHPKMRSPSEMRLDLTEIVTEYRRIWLLRNRPGGLSDSVRRLEVMMQEYE